MKQEYTISLFTEDHIGILGPDNNNTYPEADKYRKLNSLGICRKRCASADNCCKNNTVR